MMSEIPAHWQEDLQRLRQHVADAPAPAHWQEDLQRLQQSEQLQLQTAADNVVADEPSWPQLPVTVSSNSNSIPWNLNEDQRLRQEQRGLLWNA